MKKLALVLLMVLSVYLLKAETIKLTNGDWAPFCSQSLPGFGTCSMVVTEAFKEVGINVEYGFFPWKRAFENARKGNEWVGSVVWGKNSERAKDFIYPEEPVMEQKTVFFHLKDTNFDWDGTSGKLKSYKIGLTNGYSYGSFIDGKDKDASLNTEIAPHDINNMKKLLKGRIDIFPSNFAVGYQLIADNFNKADQLKFTNHELPLASSKYYLIISKAHPKSEYLLKKFNEGIAKLKAKGRIKEIFENSK